ncbi:MAG: HAD hydrolase-like protein, partial [Isosphaeraceae bacterium]
VEVVLKSANLLELIDVVVPKELIRSPKPNPACYRRALKLLTIPKEQAVVLAASFYGFTAANQADIRTLAVGHRMPKDSWPPRTAFVSDLTDPLAVLKALGFAPSPT